MFSAGPRALLAILVIPLALFVAACGGGSDETTADAAAEVDFTSGYSGEQREVAATIEAYWEAFLAGDSERLCDLTSRSEAALERCRETLPDFTPARQPRFELRALKIDGATATARMVAPSGKGKPVLIQLQRVGGEWKVAVASLPL